MPFPFFNRWAARPQDSPSPSTVSAASTPSTISAVQSQVRSILQGSSLYADTPVPSPSNRSTPKLPSLHIFRWGNTPPRSDSSEESLPRESTESRSPLRPQRTAGSYERAVVPHQYQYHDSPVVAPAAAYTRESSIYGDSVDPETAQLAILINQRARHRQRRAWVRRRGQVRTRRAGNHSIWGKTPVRRKAMLCLGSGIFLALVLTTYLSIALTHPNTGQEVHVLFILLILSTTILFCHSLVRLCMLSLRPQSAREDLPRIPSMAGPEGYQPNTPIRVHLARDEELAEDANVVAEPEKEFLKAPPPAYGLWRCSVPINPNLLHWQRVDGAHPLRQNPAVANQLLDPFQTPNPQQQHRSSGDEGPRPPSYMSDDGVRYVVEAAPRSTAPAHTPPTTRISEVHPAYRDGLGIR